MCIRDRSWIEKTSRWAQLTLVEDDPGKYDLGFWLDYFQRTRSDAACLSGGGCVAYYPTQIPFHHRSAWLGDRDVLGDLVSGSRKLGMTVLVRTDPHATYDDVQAAHPDWIAVDAQGNPRRHWASPEMWVTCGPVSYTHLDVYKRQQDQIALGLKLKQEYHIRDERDLTSCSTCHR